MGSVFDVMPKLNRIAVLLLAFLTVPAVAASNKYQDTINVFRKQARAADTSTRPTGSPCFPTIGKGGIGVGGAHGKGRVYEQGKYIGDVSMNQLTVGFQLGGKAFSEIIFFKDAARPA